MIIPKIDYGQLFMFDAIDDAGILENIRICLENIDNEKYQKALELNQLIIKSRFPNMTIEEIKILVKLAS